MNWDSRLNPYLVWILVVVLGTSLIATGGVLVGVLPATLFNQATSIVPTSATLIRRVSAVVLIVTAFVYIRSDPSDGGDGSLVSPESPPEIPRHAPQLTSAQFDALVTESLRDIQLKDIPYQNTPPRQDLRETARMGIMMTFSCDEAKAEQMLKTGTWTDDAVAEAFLASDIAYPVGFQLFRWANPGEAYTIALDQTSLAIVELINNTQENGYTANQNRDSNAGGLLSMLRADINQERIEAVSLSDRKGRLDSIHASTEYRQQHYSGGNQLKHSEIDE
jgi:hypothetical protein